jgi:hypothetical protein
MSPIIHKHTGRTNSTLDAGAELLVTSLKLILARSTPLKTGGQARCTHVNADIRGGGVHTHSAVDTGHWTACRCIHLVRRALFGVSLWAVKW